jgi:hypothetical protein
MVRFIRRLCTARLRRHRELVRHLEQVNAALAEIAALLRELHAK